MNLLCNNKLKKKAIVFVSTTLLMVMFNTFVWHLENLSTHREMYTVWVNTWKDVKRIIIEDAWGKKKKS